MSKQTDDDFNSDSVKCEHSNTEPPMIILNSNATKCEYPNANLPMILNSNSAECEHSNTDDDFKL